MLPHKHFLIAGLTIVPAAIILSPEKSVTEIGKWVLIGGIISSAIDLDIITLVFLKSKKEKRLRLFRDPLEIYRKFELFMDTIIETGVLKIGLKTHLILSPIIIVASYFLAANYFVPVLLGVVSHILSDLPYLKKIY
ncbi:hypothetical protein HY745_07605 [Candidatus Desantisbacteria bacterium]|nr:hypothetical protein [Candidatus Desantisbacteria bacterium]